MSGWVEGLVLQNRSRFKQKQDARSKFRFCPNRKKRSRRQTHENRMEATRRLFFYFRICTMNIYSKEQGDFSSCKDIGVDLHKVRRTIFMVSVKGGACNKTNWRSDGTIRLPHRGARFAFLVQGTLKCRSQILLSESVDQDTVGDLPVSTSLMGRGSLYRFLQ